MPHTVTPPSTFSTAADSEPCSRLVAGGHAAAAGRNRSSVDEAMDGTACARKGVTGVAARRPTRLRRNRWLDQRTSLGRRGRVAQCAPCPAVKRTGRYDAGTPSSCMIHERAHAARPWGSCREALVRARTRAPGKWGGGGEPGRRRSCVRKARSRSGKRAVENRGSPLP